MCLKESLCLNCQKLFHMIRFDFVNDTDMIKNDHTNDDYAGLVVEVINWELYF